MPLRPCLDCGALTSGTRCPTHHRTHTARQTRAKRTVRPERDWAERQRRAQAVAAHRAQYGDWCPGWRERPAHEVVAPNRLSADHVEAFAAGGAEDGPLVVRCVRCNSSRGAKPL